MSSKAAAGSSRVVETPYAAPALEKGLDILELLADQTEPLSLQRIAQSLERSPSELFRMVTVLERRGFLMREPDGTFRLSLRLFELAHRQQGTRRLLDAALPVMQDTALRTRQSNHLVVHHDGRILVVAQVDSPEPMGFSLRLGAHFPFSADRASPRVLCAFQPPARARSLQDELLRNSPRLGRRKLLAQLVHIVADGFFEVNSATTAGVTDVSCPVRDHTGGALAALTMPYLTQRDTGVDLPTCRAILIESAQRISGALGWSVRS